MPDHTPNLNAAAADLFAAAEKALGFVNMSLEFWDWRHFPLTQEAAEKLRDELTAATLKARGE